MPWKTDQLLEPIAGENPSGVSLRYDPIYKEVEEARREEEAGPQGQWQTERKVADWPLVIKLCEKALAERTKDLYFASRLTEAMLRREGYSGLRGGLDYIAALMDRYWDTLHPEPEDGDLEPRSAPLVWLGSKLDVAVKMVPITPAKHDWLQYKESRTVPTEAQAKAETAKQELRKKMTEKQGKLAPEPVDAAIESVGKAFYKPIAADLKACLKRIGQLTAFCDERFGDVSPSFIPLRKSIEEVLQVVDPILAKKLEADPDPPEIEELPEVEPGVEPEAGPVVDAPVGGLTADPVNTADAVSRIMNAARYLRRQHLAHPSAYLMVRAFRWGEIRACADDIDPRLLEAPTTAQRTQLKTLLLEQRWAELLEAAETAMAMPCGRGWLDLQRYTVTACENLGAEYAVLASAIRAVTQIYLRDAPRLLGMTLLDDISVANAETRAWLGRMYTATERTMAAHTETGTAPETLAELNAALARASSARSRFLLRTQMARLLVEGGREAIALPMLEQLAQEIDEHKLEEWEDGAVTAEPLVLLYRAMAKSGGDPAVLQGLYLRICKLDPLQAIDGLGQ